jgi:hypothetical protein
VSGCPTSGYIVNRMSDCHPDRKYFAKGKCEECYAADYLKENRERRRLNSERYNRAHVDKAIVSNHLWHRANAEIVHLKHIQAQYKLSPEAYRELYAAGCWLCGEPFNPEKRRPSVDHDHQCCPGSKCCGECVRGLAHHICNTIIAREDPEFLRRIADNLEQYLCS